MYLNLDHFGDESLWKVQTCRFMQSPVIVEGLKLFLVSWLRCTLQVGVLHQLLLSISNLVTSVGQHLDGVHLTPTLRWGKESP